MGRALSPTPGTAARLLQDLTLMTPGLNEGQIRRSLGLFLICHKDSLLL